MTGLRAFVTQEYGRTKWAEVKEAAGVETEHYTRMEDYPDEEFIGIYTEVVKDADASDDALQQAFGQFLFGKMAEMYGRVYFDDDWGAIDLINNVEETIHQSLKMRDDSGFTPPELETEPLGENAVAVLYSSERHLCEFGKGLIQGTAEHYGTDLTIGEPECMKDGDDICRIEVRETD